MFEIINNKLFQHLSAIGIVLIFASGVNILLSKSDLKSENQGIYLPNLGKGKSENENFVKIKSALKSGDSLVMLGSSELTSSDLENISYKALPKNNNIPIIAYGHAHFQSLGVAGLISANEGELSEKSKIVILVSPGWFAMQSIPLNAFVEHFTSPVIVPLYKNRMKPVIQKYVETHIDEFSQIGLTEKAFIGKKEGLRKIAYDNYIELQDVKNKFFLFSARARLFIKNEDHSSNYVKQYKIIDDREWDALEEHAMSAEISHMKNNTHWVRDDYYSKYLNNIPREGIKYFPEKFDDSFELEDLKLALSILKDKSVRPLVVMQPINPYVYTDSVVASEIALKIQRICEEMDFDYFNMIDENYKPGTLRDGMHLGEFGWVKINRKITETLYK